MKKLAIIFLLSLLLLPGVSAQEEYVDFYASNKSPYLAEIATNQYVQILFFGRWGNSTEKLIGTENVTVWIGVDVNITEDDLQLESQYDISTDAFFVNFSYSQTAKLTFYIADLLINDRPVPFLQSSPNATIVFNSALETPTDQGIRLSGATLTIIGISGGGLLGMLVLIIYYFNKQSLKRKEYERKFGNRKRKMEDRSSNE